MIGSTFIIIAMLFNLSIPPDPLCSIGELRRMDDVVYQQSSRTEPVSRGAIRTLSMEITAYSEHYESCGKHPGEPGYGITASGEKVREGIVAADTRVLPMHSIIEIEGYGRFEVKDTGSAIKGNKLDLYLPSHKSALKWGRKTLKVHIIRLGE